MTNCGKHCERKESGSGGHTRALPFTAGSLEASLRTGQLGRDEEKQELARQREGQTHSQWRESLYKGPRAGESLVLWRC